MRCFSRVNVASVVLNKLEMMLETFLSQYLIVLKGVKVNPLLQSLLLSVIASMISILFFGVIAFFIRKKITNYLENKFLPDFLERLKAKEEAKSNVQHDTWKKQQLWEIKKNAYDSISQCLIKMQRHIEKRLEESKHFHYVFNEHCGQNYINFPEGTPPNVVSEYEWGMEKEIELEEQKYYQKYKTKDFKEAELIRIKQDNKALQELTEQIKKELIYLDQESKPLISYTEELLKHNFYPEKYDPEDGLQDYEYWEGVIEKDKDALARIESKLADLESLHKKEILN